MRRPQTAAERLAEIVSSSSDEEGGDKNERKRVAEKVMQVFDGPSEQPESRSLKMHRQLRTDKLLTLLATFETSLAFELQK